MNDTGYFELALQQELAAAEEVVTGWILEGQKEELALFREDLKIGEGPENEVTKLTPHQFAQLSAIAEDSDSVPVVINYLRYQIGRAKPDEGWRWHGIGECLVTLLTKDVREQAYMAASRAAGRVRGRGVGTSKEEKRQAWVALTCRFLAALYRRFTQRAKDLDYRQEGTQ